MSSKLVGVDSDFFANMILDAATSVQRTGNKGEVKVPIKSINILKAHGGNMKESRLIKGYALNCTVSSEGKLKLFFLMTKRHGTGWLGKFILIGGNQKRSFRLGE